MKTPDNESPLRLFSIRNINRNQKRGIRFLFLFLGALRDTKPVKKIETGVLRFCFLKTEEKPDPIFSFERHGTRTGRRARFERSLLTAGGGRRAPRVTLPGGPARVRRRRSRRQR